MTEPMSWPDADREMKITWNRIAEEEVTVVSASIGGATITVRTTDESVNLVPWLLSAMPEVLVRAVDAMGEED